MITQLKIKATGSSKFTAPLHTSFQQSMYAIVTSLPPADLAAWRIQPLLSDWAESIAVEVDINRESQKSNQTKTINELDQQRDRIIAYIFGIIRVERTSGLLPQRQQAAEQLSRLLTTYRGIQDEAYRKQSATTDGLINDLNKPEDFQHLQTLGLAPYVSQLKTANDEFRDALLNRMATKAVSKLPTSTAQRKVTSDIFTRICERIHGIFIFVDTDAERERINHLVTLMNNNIDEFRAEHNRAQGISGKGGSTTPAIQPGGTTPRDPNWEEPADGE